MAQLAHNSLNCVPALVCAIPWWICCVRVSLVITTGYYVSCVTISPPTTVKKMLSVSFQQQNPEICAMCINWTRFIPFFSVASASDSGETLAARKSRRGGGDTKKTFEWYSSAAELRSFFVCWVWMMHFNFFEINLCAHLLALSSASQTYTIRLLLFFSPIRISLSSSVRALWRQKICFGFFSSPLTNK